MADLLPAPYTYAQVGATASALPRGYTHLRRTRVLHDVEFDAAVERLMTWQVHERAGLRVAVSSARATPGTVVEMRLGPSRLGVTFPCRVVYVVSEPARAGFAYGTLPGHPEAGEELFTVGRGDDGTVAFTIAAFSNPATPLARAAGPVGRWLQARMTTRYLSAMQ
ncbi:DUF1990 family protein [Nocardioides sp. LHG3406-4]|uniref:DUF1990 family protein n=1 Tax=Nocardioides sp. LHG3406-4 TaxID=2804575 RepID=UPI003CE81B07